MRKLVILLKNIIFCENDQETTIGRGGQAVCRTFHKKPKKHLRAEKSHCTFDTAGHATKSHRARIAGNYSSARS